MRKTGEWNKKNPPKCRFHGTDLTVTVSAGLYFYEGFGLGKFFHPNGSIWDCSPQEGTQMAREAGVAYDYRDSFDYYVPVAVGD